jgi:hypothetical protein
MKIKRSFYKKINTTGDHNPFLETQAFFFEIITQMPLKNHLA